MIYIINFKAYVWGKKALGIARKIEKAALEKDANVLIAVQPVDIYFLKQNVNLGILAQHVDCIRPGAKTGWILPESVRDAGAVGSLVNHSEHPVDLYKIKKIIRKLRALGMMSVVCVPDLDLLEEVLDYKPDYIAYEPPELIGGEISVSEAKPEVIKEAVDLCGEIPLLVGAGIKRREDVVRAKELGAKGILVASGVVKAEDPYKKMLELII